MTLPIPPLFFDANCMIGLRSFRHPETIWRLEDFLADFEYYDIAGALVHHASAVQYSQDYGNRQLLDEIAGHERLAPQWVVMPHHTFEMAPPDELVAETLRLNVRAARMCPGTQGFGTREDVVGPLLAKLQAHRIPLFVDVSELDLPGAVDLCRRYPELPVVLCSVAWSSDRLINALLGGVPNLHLDTWAFQGHRAYERFVEQFGPGRLLFSTGLPERSPGAARMMAVYERLDDEACRAIAGGNLLRLLSEVRGAQGEPPKLLPYGEREDDPIVARVRVGAPLRGEFIIDAHAHIAHDGAMGYFGCALPYNDADSLVGTMDRLGIDLAMPSTWGGIRMGDPASNDIAVAAARRHPRRLLPYGCANPSYPDIVAAEIQRVFAPGLVHGFKPYPPGHQVALTDPRNCPLLALSHERQWPVLCHMGFNATGSVTPDQVDGLAAQYPGATFLCGHAGQSWPMAEAVAAVAGKRRNVITEITYTAVLYGFVEYFVREVGAEQIVFGTDCVMRDAAPQLGWVAWARLPLDAKRLILGGNMARILRLPPERRVPVAAEPQAAG